MSIVEGSARRRFERAGYLVIVDDRDRGVFRVFRPAVPLPRLVGMFVVRDNRFTYAEFRGRVFPFHPASSYRQTLGSLYRNVRKTPA